MEPKRTASKPWRIFKICSVILIPPVILAILTVSLQGGKNILDGVYFLFPLLFFVQALLSANITHLVLGALLSSVAFLFPINLLYHMGSCLELLTVYLFIAAAGYLIRHLFIRHRMKKKYLRH
ncbi:MAG: hypothetical protein IJY47_02780 [Clostridia bacterium]|nr:hypothetical protein [Clostridia bacterium]